MAWQENHELIRPTGEGLRYCGAMTGKLIQQGLNLFGILEEDLLTLKKGDDRKKVIAWYIRKKTSVRVEWITQRLKMGVTSNFSRYIRAVDRSKEGPLWNPKVQMTI